MSILMYEVVDKKLDLVVQKRLRPSVKSSAPLTEHYSWSPCLFLARLGGPIATVVIRANVS